jgi:GNAT superfamily N-acetyltransferase
MARLTFRPVTSREWTDLEALFGPRGACGGCWCMWWRLPRSRFDRDKGTGNRASLKKLVDAGTIPGILAYSGERAVGWCSVGPREDFSSLERSRVLARVDEQPVWSIVCFFVAKDLRRTGVTSALIKAAIRYARGKGARIIEAYPVEPAASGTADVFAFTGVASTFRDLGFVEAARRSTRRAVYRLTFKGKSRSA